MPALVSTTPGWIIKANEQRSSAPICAPPVLMAGTDDARGFRQWKAAGRHVKKGRVTIPRTGSSGQPG